MSFATCWMLYAGFWDTGCYMLYAVYRDTFTLSPSSKSGSTWLSSWRKARRSGVGDYSSEDKPAILASISVTARPTRSRYIEYIFFDSLQFNFNYSNLGEGTGEAGAFVSGRLRRRCPAKSSLPPLPLVLLLVR